MGLSIVVPSFNEEATLPELHRRATRAAEGIVSQDLELVLVNDDSLDRTWAQWTVMATGAAREGLRAQAAK